MSRIRFDGLSIDRPELNRAISLFVDWSDKHPSKRVIDPRALSRYMKDVPALELFELCRELVERGFLIQAFAVEASNGQLIGGTFDSPLNIPAFVPGSFESWVDVSDATVVPVFIEPETSSE